MLRPSLLLVACLASCATPPEQTFVPIDLPGWMGQGADLGRGRGTIMEYYPPGETIDEWSHLATVQFLEGNHSKARAIMEELRAAAWKRRAQGAVVTWDVVAEDDYSITYEWSIREANHGPEQVEVARLLEGRDGAHRVAFTRMGTSFEDHEREAWLAALAGAFVFKGKDLITPLPEGAAAAGPGAPTSAASP